MTRLFLAAGVAALAISAPAVAKPGGGHGGNKDAQAASTQHGGGGGQRAQAPRRGGGGFDVQRAQRSQRMAMPRMERGQRSTFQRSERSQRFAASERRPERSMKVNRAERRAERAVNRPARAERMQTRAAERQQLRVNRGNAKARMVERQQLRGNRAENRMAAREQFRGNHGNRFERIDNRMAVRDQLRGDRTVRLEGRNRLSVNALGGCPPGLMAKGCMPPGQALKVDRIANAEAFRGSRLAALTLGTRNRILDPFVATRFVGAPLSLVSRSVPLMAFPANVAYLYPDTPDYYYRYGNGYLYEVDRDTSLISALLPLLGGGFLPGQYLPNYYMSSPYYGMNSYYPAAYGFNSFYPDYGNNCYRYGYGVVYEVDCFTGMVEDVIPTYAGGYGVGQILPSGYGYYNVPSQYRSLYYNTPDYNYWYAPGAIYQYDPGSSMITSVAALLSPGFSIGQPLPMGYGAYNVPYAYRSTYYDTPNAWYRYNNGYIYQVDPVTQLVTAVVASLLT